MAQLKSKEHADLMAQFEEEFRGVRMDKEPKELWAKSIIYQNGEVNGLFIAYRKGYALAKAIYGVGKP